MAHSSVCLHCGRPGFDPWVKNIPWRRKWQPTPVSLSGRFHGQRNLGGLEDSMDRGIWQATVHGATKSQKQLSDFTFTFHFHM